MKCFRRAFQFGNREHAGGKRSEEIVRIRVHKKIAENFFRIRQVCVHALKRVKCVNTQNKDIENSKTIHIKGWNITLLQQSNRSKRKSGAP